jgi:hypothetical protein
MSENDTLLERLDALTQENKRLLDLIARQNNAHHDYKTRVCLNNYKKIMEMHKLRDENKSLQEKLQKEYNECILEKKKLMEEIDHIKKILTEFIDGFKYEENSNKRARVDCK